MQIYSRVPWQQHSMIPRLNGNFKEGALSCQPERLLALSLRETRTNFVHNSESTSINVTVLVWETSHKPQFDAAAVCLGLPIRVDLIRVCPGCRAPRAFSVNASSEVVGKGKPHPHIWLLVLQQMLTLASIWPGLSPL